MKKTTSLFLSLLIAGCVMCTGCSGGETEGNKDDIAYTKYDSSTVAFDDYSLINQKIKENNFDHETYYRNDLNLDMGDPMVIYVEEENLFYAYGTRGGSSACCIDYFTSYNLTDWTYGGACFTPPTNSWVRSTKEQLLWAPDVQKIGGKWYLYFTVPAVQSPDGTVSREQISVAVGDSPRYFEQWTGTNALGQKIGVTDRNFNGLENSTILDQNIFQDDDGQLYMYMSFDTGKSQLEEHEHMGYAEIYGVKLLDPVTWDLSTLTRLASPGAKNLDDKNDLIDWEHWSASFNPGTRCSEGPYMIKNEGKYYLTYCSNSFVDNHYNVGYAVSDEPLGNFDKPWSEEEPLKNMILGVPGGEGTAEDSRYKGIQTGTGHACILKVGSEYMIAYHAHMNRDSWGVVNEYSQHGDWRALALDYLYFDKDGAPYTNGPTWSLVRLPEAVSGLRNVVLDDGVQVNAQCENVSALYDNKTDRAFSNANDARFKAGTRSIEVKLGKQVKVKAVNIYNSADYSTFIDYIDQIDFGNGKGAKDIFFNPYLIGHRELTIGTENYVFPHAAFTVYLENTVVTDRVVITITADNDFTLGEIEILGENV